MRKPTALAALILALSLLAGCSGQELAEEDRRAIVETLEGYLPLLAQGYATGNLEPLQELASEREVARVYARVSELAGEGKYVEPTFRRMTVEEVIPVGRSTVYVTTLEVWDLRTLVSGSEVVLGEELDQSSRVKYQLGRRGGGWQVLLRELGQVIE